MFTITGDILGLNLTSAPSAQISSGIVTRVSPTQICVAFEQSEELSLIGDDCQYYLVKLANDVTYKRLRRSGLTHSITNCSSYMVRGAYLQTKHGLCTDTYLELT